MLSMFRITEVDNQLPDLPPLFAVNKAGNRGDEN